MSSTWSRANMKIMRLKDCQHHLHKATAAKLHVYNKIASMEKLLPVKTEQMLWFTERRAKCYSYGHLCLKSTDSFVNELSYYVISTHWLQVHKIIIANSNALICCCPTSSQLMFSKHCQTEVTLDNDWVIDTIHWHIRRSHDIRKY